MFLGDFFVENSTKRLIGKVWSLFSVRMGRTPKVRRNSYGAWLHYLRREANLTQEKAAKVTGIPRTTLTTWERTGDMPGRKEIFRLAKAYRVSIARLLRTEKLDKD